MPDCGNGGTDGAALDGKRKGVRQDETKQRIFVAVATADSRTAFGQYFLRVDRYPAGFYDFFRWGRRPWNPCLFCNFFCDCGGRDNSGIDSGSCADDPGISPEVI